MHIMSQPRNALLKQYRRLFAYERIDLEFTRRALAAMAKRALAHKTGARSLRTIAEELLTLPMCVPCAHARALALAPAAHALFPRRM